MFDLADLFVAVALVDAFYIKQFVFFLKDAIKACF